MDMYENAIEIKGITKKYDGFTLDNVSFEVPKGSIMGFIGQNGAGIVLRANDMKSLKKLGAIAGGIGAVILLALEFIPSGVSDSELETFMTEVETASSPVILNKYIGFVTIPDAAGIIGIILTVVILIAGFIVTLKNHKRREV